jgi:dephospho-CoA kinase
MSGFPPYGRLPDVLKVGLTGGIGSGKSAVARLLAERGAAIIDADELAREVVAPGTPGLAEIVAAFGDEVLLPDGSLDRPALGRIVFADPEQRRRLEKITHPLIGEETFRRMDALSDSAVVVHDVPLLAEGRMEGLYDCVLVVEAPREVRLARLEQRGLPRSEAERRMASQATDEQRRAIATYVIDNSGTLAGLRRQVDEIWAKLTG